MSGGAVSQPENMKPDAGPRAMSRVIQLLKTLAKHRQGLTLTELSNELDVPKSTLLNSLRPLVSDDYLVTEETRYKLGPSSFRFAAGIMSAFSMPDIIETYVHILANQTRESVGFGIADWKAWQLIYIKTVPSTQPVVYSIATGANAPLYASAGGRILLAYGPEDLREDYLSRKRFRQLTSITETEPSRLREVLIQTRAQGYSLSYGELLEDIGSIAVPVLDGSGLIFGSLTISGPLDRIRCNTDSLLKSLVIAGRRASGMEVEVALS